MARNCAQCGGVIPLKAPGHGGRPAKLCGSACRQAWYRAYWQRYEKTRLRVFTPAQLEARREAARRWLREHGRRPEDHLRRKIRAHAREEARAQGVPVKQIFAQWWGVA
jgi:hypothetical protein